MDLEAAQKPKTRATPGADDGMPLFRCLSLDLEVGGRDRCIHAFAGVRSDTGMSLTFSGLGAGLSTALERLDELA